MPSLATAEAFDVIKHVRCYGGESGPEHDTLSTGSRTSITTTRRSVNPATERGTPCPANRSHFGFDKLAYRCKRRLHRGLARMLGFQDHV